MAKKIRNKLEEADRICEFIKSNAPLEERVAKIEELGKVFGDLNARGKKLLLGEHLHTLLLAGVRNRDNLILIRLTNLFASYTLEEQESFGLDEKTYLELYKSGIKAWFTFPGCQEGVLALFGWPREDLAHTVSYLDNQVRKEYPELAESINIVIADIKRTYKFRGNY